MTGLQYTRTCKTSPRVILPSMAKQPIQWSVRWYTMLASSPPIFMYNLITSTGKVLSFEIKSCADLYQKAYGGVVFTQQVLDNASSYDTMIPSNEKGNEYVYNPWACYVCCGIYCCCGGACAWPLYMESSMSRMSDLHLTIQEELMNGDLLPVEIAERYNVPLEWVRSVVVDLCEFQSMTE